MTIVSGLALGIDGAAHEGGLAGAGSTIAVVGTGLDRVYPARHRALAHRIAKRRPAAVSEFALGTPPLAANFPQRNRIIAGLARGTLVVEAALQSGSLITARPGARSRARGVCDSRLDPLAAVARLPRPDQAGRQAGRHGAGHSRRAELDAGRRPWPRRQRVDAPSDDPLLDALGHDPVTLDALLARTGESAAVLNARLLELELEGRVARLPGGLFQRRGNG